MTAWSSTRRTDAKGPAAPSLMPVVLPVPLRPPADDTEGVSAARELRVLVAVQPVVLEGALAAILELIGLDQVVQFHRTEEIDPATVYDAAIVSAGFPDVVRARATITLPDTEASGGSPGSRRPGHVSAGSTSRQVDIRDQRQIIDLLDQHVPTVTSRKDRLLQVLTARAS